MPSQALPSRAEHCRAKYCQVSSSLRDTLYLKPSIRPRLLRPPIAESDASCTDIQPALQFFLVNQFLVGIDDNFRAPLVKLCTGAQDAGALNHDADGELRVAPQLIDGFAKRLFVIFEGDAFNLQTLADSRTLF